VAAGHQGRLKTWKWGIGPAPPSLPHLLCLFAPLPLMTCHAHMKYDASTQNMLLDLSHLQFGPYCWITKSPQQAQRLVFWQFKFHDFHWSPTHQLYLNFNAQLQYLSRKINTIVLQLN
jgi:hypothetical protein